MLTPRPALLLPPGLETERQLLGYRLLRDGNAELARLRVTRGAHKRTARRIQRALAVVALAASLLGIPLVEQSDAAGMPGFAPPVASPDGLRLPTEKVLSVPAFVDIDDDGDLDAFLGAGSGETFFQRNTGSAASPAFAPPTTNAFGLTDVGQSAAPTFADIDNDGDFDALIGSESGNLFFFRNNGDADSPQFATASINLADVGEAVVPTFVDINGNNRIDVLVGRKGGDTVLFRNTGSPSSPSFAAPSVDPFDWPLLGSAEGRIVPRLTDIDADGDLDAFVGFGSGGLALFENTGTKVAPAFDEPEFTPFCASLSTGMLLPAPDLADIDGDGDLDVLAGVSSGDVVLLENTGTASQPVFASPYNGFGITDVGFKARPTLADIDSDDDLDAFVGNSDGDTLFFENTGSEIAPRFARAVTNPFGLANVGDPVAAPTFVDLESDGDLDAFIGRDDGATIFFRNTGSASGPRFAAPSTNPFNLQNIGPQAAPVFVDIDGDDDQDAFIGNEFGEVYFFEWNGGGFLAPTYTNLGPVEYYAVPSFADIDGDNDYDAFIGGGSEMYFFENTGTVNAPSFAEPIDNIGLVAVGTRAAPVLGDIDADGDYDALVGNRYGHTFFFENTQAASIIDTFASSRPFGLHDVGHRAAPTFVDFDGDGDLDVVVGNSFGDLYFFEWRDGRFLPPGVNPSGLTSVDDDAFPDFVDIDQDGDSDAFVGNGDGDIFFFENTSAPVGNMFAPAQINPFGLSNVDDEAAPSFVDIDADGDLDVFVGNGYGDFVFFRNTLPSGVQKFGAPSVNPFGLSTVGSVVIETAGALPTFEDIDGDGDFDALVGSFLGYTVLFENTGTASQPHFAAPVREPFRLATVAYYASPAFVDIDGDGDLDAFLGNGEGYLLLAENTASPVCGSTILVEPARVCGAKPNCFATMQEGIDAAPKDFTVQVSRAFFDQNLDVHLTGLEAVVVEGGWNASFTQREPTGLTVSLDPVAGETTVSSMTIRGGTVRLE